MGLRCICFGHKWGEWDNIGNCAKQRNCLFCGKDDIGQEHSTKYGICEICGAGTISSYDLGKEIGILISNLLDPTPIMAYLLFGNNFYLIKTPQETVINDKIFNSLLECSEIIKKHIVENSEDDRMLKYYVFTNWYDYSKGTFTRQAKLDSKVTKLISLSSGGDIFYKPNCDEIIKEFRDMKENILCDEIAQKQFYNKVSGALINCKGNNIDGLSERYASYT